MEMLRYANGKQPNRRASNQTDKKTNKQANKQTNKQVMQARKSMPLSVSIVVANLAGRDKEICHLKTVCEHRIRSQHPKERTD